MKPTRRTIVASALLVTTLMAIVGGSAAARSSTDVLPKTPSLGDPQQACSSPTSTAPAAPSVPTTSDNSINSGTADAAASDPAVRQAPTRRDDLALPATGNAGVAASQSAFVGFGTLQQNCSTPTAAPTARPTALPTTSGIGGDFSTGSGSNFSLPPGSLY